MKIEAVNLIHCALPLRQAWIAGSSHQTSRHALLVEVETDIGVGWGECSAMNAPTYTPEYAAGAALVIEHHLAPRLLQAEEIDAASVPGLLHTVVGHPMAKSALEMAVLDAELRHRDESLAHRLGVTAHKVRAGAAVGMGDDDPSHQRDLLATARPLVEAGYRRIKLKIRPGNDQQRITALRHEFPGLEVQVDANGAYAYKSDDDIAGLDWLDDAGISLIEQPFPATELGAHRRLAHRLRTPICLDEPITHLAAARDAIASEACEVMNLKVGRVGGITSALAIHDLCVTMGVPVWIGGMLDTGIGRAVNAVCNGLRGVTIIGDLSASSYHYESDVVVDPLAVTDGWMTVPHDIGIGATIDPDSLASLTTSRTTITAH